MPKPAEQRRRRNKVKEPTTLAAAPGKAPAIGIAKPSAGVKKWWALAWASPMASQWLDADVPTLRRLALLLESAERGEFSAPLLAEIRQLEDRFGLSPLARTRLQWKPDKASAVASKTKPAAEEQGKRWLEAV